MKLTEKELRLIGKLLSYAAPLIARRCCDDADPAWLKEFTRDELVSMNREYHDWNGDPEEAFERSGCLLELSASGYAHLFGNRIQSCDEEV